MTVADWAYLFVCVQGILIIVVAGFVGRCRTQIAQLQTRIERIERTER